MADPFVAEIRIFPFNFAPTGWAFCSGQILPISQNTALFSLLGTYYGGDGKSTFALPNLQGSCALGQGQGPGLSDYFLGQQAGSENVTLIITEIPMHTHNLMATVEDGTQGSLTQGITIATSVGGPMYQTTTNQQNVTMDFQSLSIAGASMPHNNMMPYLTLNMCIALQGVFPPRP
jgi:microcystin-dependent protein